MAVTSFLRRFKSPTILSQAIWRSNSTTVTSSFSTQCFVRRTASLSVPTEATPAPKKIPFAVSTHGITREDPYRWMRNTDDPDFLDFLERENSYAQAFMADTETLRRDLISEMKTRIPDEIVTPPERWGPWLYRQYIPKGKEYPLLCRRLEKVETSWLSGLSLVGGRAEEEEVVLDWNQIAEQFGYVHVGVCRVSPDHNYLAYTVDPKGDERFLLQIKDLRSGCLVQRLDVDGVVSLAWALDGMALFYTVVDENQRPHRVVVTNVKSDGRADTNVFIEKDPSFCVDITSTKDGKFVTINSNSRTSSEVYIVDANKPLAGFKKTRERVPGVQCFLEHYNGYFYILTNAPTNAISERSGEGYHLTRCLVEEIEASDWQTVFCPDDDVVIQDMDMFSDYMVLFLNKKGLPMICSIDMPMKEDTKHMEDLNPWYFPLPADPCTVAPGSNHNFESSVYRVVLSSPVIPDTIIDYDVSRRSFSIVKQEKRLIDHSDSCMPRYSEDHSTDYSAGRNDGTNEGQSGQLDSEMPKWKDLSDAYVCERLEVSSYDGVEVPLTVLYSREAWKKSESPGILAGYGAYGEALDKSWCTNRLSMLDRGWVIAFADVRGGGGRDFSWHKSGMGSLKQNSIQDFIYSAKYLIEKGYVHRDHLAAIGYSAGSILPAAAMNMHPSLFRAAILKVPFVDVLNTLSDPNLPLTLLDYEEFGNPNVHTEFQSILGYSPYDNIRRDGCYPSMLVTTSFHDSRVGVWEGAKWVAKVRESTCHDCSRAVILKTNMSGGHFGEGGRYAQCEETAFDYAFLIKVMGHNS